MKRMLRLFALVLSVLFVATVVYSAVVVVLARHDTPRIVDEVLASGRITLQPKDFPPGWIDDLLAVEDPAFYRHDGMDLRTPGAGITTLTQGMVKYLYFERFEPGFAKLKQTLIAVFALDAMVPKDTQLTIAVNTLYLGEFEGRRIAGFDEAARTYFGKPFRQLTHREYLSLVAMIIAPNAFHVKLQPEANALRVQRIERLLAGQYKPRGLMDLYYDQP